MEKVAVLKPLLAIRKNLTRILRSFVKDCYILLRLSLNNEKACCECFKSLFAGEKNTHELIQLLCYADIILQFIQCVGAGFPYPCSSNGKESDCNAGDQGSIPGLGSSSGKWNGNPLQYSCLENSRDRGAWQATTFGIAKSRTQLSN